jgi:hypothetical protein
MLQQLVQPVVFHKVMLEREVVHIVVMADLLDQVVFLAAVEVLPQTTFPQEVPPALEPAEEEHLLDKSPIRIQ